MKNIIHSCENCGHCDEDCTVYMENKQSNNDDKTDCLFWVEDTATVKIETDDETQIWY